MRALKYVLIACVGAAALVVFFMPKLGSFQKVIATAFNGKTDIGPESQYAVVCAGFDCDEVLPRLPPVSDVWCSQSLRRSDLRKYDIHMTGPGACCRAVFGELGGTEVHIFRQAKRYAIILTEPRMRDVIKALDEQPRPESL